mmetsp:Transcript_116883/g.337776  ORF Transcript_116883/g.337776 Transcript_116883/m.337776 type:complete len:276 (+) Transcript_116883:283-1110(+)
MLRLAQQPEPQLVGVADGLPRARQVPHCFEKLLDELCDERLVRGLHLLQHLLQLHELPHSCFLLLCLPFHDAVHVELQDEGIFLGVFHLRVLRHLLDQALHHALGHAVRHGRVLAKVERQAVPDLLCPPLEAQELVDHIRQRPRRQRRDVGVAQTAVCAGAESPLRAAQPRDSRPPRHRRVAALQAEDEPWVEAARVRRGKLEHRALHLAHDRARQLVEVLGVRRPRELIAIRRVVQALLQLRQLGLPLLHKPHLLRLRQLRQGRAQVRIDREDV